MNTKTIRALIINVIGTIIGFMITLVIIGLIEVIRK